MFFVISKLVEFFLIPSNLIALLGMVGIPAALLGRFRLGRACIIASVLLLAICGWSPLGPAALMLLENRFPQPVIDMPVAGIILLGGAVDPHISSYRGTLAMNEAGERLTATVDLSRRYPDARIFLSGGLGQSHGASTLTESKVARDILVSLGVSPERIEMEERSRNTCENGTESAASIQPKPGELWLLVTSASHMPRAIGCFRAAGFDVTPYPVDYRTRGAADLKRPTDSITVGLAATDLAAHEWFGLLTYRIAGLTAELFPSVH
ncbi:YdcF family protein [Mesorhizobium qingshengii]|uniref:YdcF family protein n=1 Tax=Mesorhizobium qingshengii TaxID=1165689 RepID=A0ABT4R2F0_9HYPH|nr:YdcF family protein [Mesorhizobium qingshengii]MCZ8547909.1 YdcF family protein [Mesorhizobium qingshengii]